MTTRATTHATDSRGFVHNTVDYISAETFVRSVMGKFILFRIRENRDVKIVITSRGHTTGTGKTTLAINLAHAITEIAQYFHDELDVWDAREHSFINANQYLDQYEHAPPGTVLLTDELEYMVDNRRSLSHDNVEFTEAWQMLRYKNVVTIGTAPGKQDLDKRVMENCDIWIRVIGKGVAVPYYMTVDDFTEIVEPTRFKYNGRKSNLQWGDLAGHPDYEFMKELKRTEGIPGRSKQIDEGDLSDARRDTKLTITERLIEHNLEHDTGLSQDSMAEITGWSQPKISQIKRDLEA